MPGNGLGITADLLLVSLRTCIVSRSDQQSKVLAQHGTISDISRRLVPCAVNTPRVTDSNRHRRMDATHPAKLAGQFLWAAPRWPARSPQVYSAMNLLSTL